MGLYLMLVIESIMGCATSEFNEFMSSFLGLPVNERILSSWFRVEFPGIIGFPDSSYANIQPILHTSALFS